MTYRGPSKSRLPVSHFGKRWPASMHAAECALECFRDGYVCKEKGAYFGWGRLQFFSYAAQHFLPSIQWYDESGMYENTWLKAQISSLCGVGVGDPHESVIGDTRVRCVYWTGCASAGKTHGAGFFSYLWWMCDPENSSVTLTSTSKIAVGQRVWPVIQKCHNDWRNPWTDLPQAGAHLVDSMKKVQAVKGDDLHAIHALAVEKGELNRAINGIKGRHTKRMMLIIDEANTTANAVFEVLHNMSAGCSELIVLIIGNAISRLDNHGRCCEPDGGWASINIGSGRWKTAGVPDWNLEPGLCVHFDGNRSPNVLAKRTVFPFLYSYENFLRRKHGVKSPQHWSNERGFWPTSGVVYTVLDELLMVQANVRGTFTFDGETTMVGGLDPGFTGDKALAVIGRMGLISGRMCLQVVAEEEIELDAESLVPIDHQVAREYMKLCKHHGVQADCAGSDATGTGRGVYSILQEEWAYSVHRVEFGGAASDMMASIDDPRPGNKAYKDRVTELWYTIKHLVQAEQLRGLSRDAVTQFCTREFKLLPGDRVVLDEKKICKQKLGRSPDNADAIAVMVHVAKLKGLVAQSTVSDRVDQDWESLAKETNDIGNNGMQEENEVELPQREDLEVEYAGGSRYWGMP